MNAQLALVEPISVPLTPDARERYVSALDENPAAVYLAGLAVGGRASMRSKLKQVALVLGYAAVGEVPWHRLRYQHLMAVRSRLQGDGLAPATVNGVLAAIRGVLRAAYNLGLLSGDDHERARHVEAVRGSRLLAGRALAPEEVQALIRVCILDPTPRGPRDAALVGLLYACGLRRAEVTALDRSDYDAETGELVVRGKGDKERLGFVTGGAADALRDWLATRGDIAGPFFFPILKSGRLAWRRFGSQGVYMVLRRRGREAGLKPFSPHDLRRTFVSDLLDAGADLVTVQQLAGHANVQTTARYDRRGEGARRAASKLLTLPYVSRQKTT